jgi:hypothetical protein
MEGCEMKKIKFIALVMSVCLITGLFACVAAQTADEPDTDNTAETDTTDTTDKPDEVKEIEEVTEPEKDYKTMSMPGNFTVTGHTIYTPGGAQFVAKGTNVNGPGGFFTRDTLQDIELICDAWKFNTVRLITSPGSLWQRFANKDLEAIVNAFTEKGVVVMIERHEYSGVYPDENQYDNSHLLGYTDFIRYSLEDFTAQWVEWALMFKDNPYVWFNIMNEPAGNTDPSNVTRLPGMDLTAEESANMWFDTHDYIIKAIREAGAENIIVLDEHWWGQGGYNQSDPDGYGSAILNKGPMLNTMYENLVYSLHPYGWTDYNRMLSFVTDCHERGLALVIGEYGARVGDVNTHNSAQFMFDVAIPYGVGRIHWAWSEDNFHLTDENPGGGFLIDITDGVNKPTNLTWLGSLIWDDNRGLATSPTPDHNFAGVKNGDFENGFSGWQNTGTPRPLIVEERGSHNNSACACLVKEGGGYTSTRLSANLIRPGMTYKFSAWGKSSPGITEDLAAVTLAYRTESGGEETEQVIFFGEAEWTYKEIIFTMPDYIHSVRIMVSRPDGTDFFFDDVELTVVTN